MVWSDESRKIVLNRSITALQLLKAFAFSSHRQTREWSNRVHTPEQLGHCSTIQLFLNGVTCLD